MCDSVCENLRKNYIYCTLKIDLILFFQLNGQPSEELRFGLLTITERQQCANIFANLPTPIAVRNNEICASNPGTDFCTGSFGAPLFSGGIVVGLASVTLDCGVTSVPGIYVQISRYTNWILQVATGVPSI